MSLDVPVPDSVRESGPVFIVGMNGSGTTMLADSLGRHPQLYVFPLEVRVLPFFLRDSAGQSDCATMSERRRLAHALGRSKPFWHANERRPLLLADEDLQRPGVPATVDAVFMHFARQAGKSRWAEKSPMNVLHMGLLAEVFPDARFIHLVRDGRDAAQSFHRRYGFSPCETISRWKRVVRQGSACGIELGPKRYLELRYEELTADPRAGMTGVCDFLGLPFDERVLESSMRMAGEALAATGRTMVANSGKWVDYFSAQQVAELERIAGRQLRTLGYAAGLAGDEDPGRLRRMVWRASGVWHRSVKHFRRWGWAGVPGYLKGLLVSARQTLSGRG